MLRWSMWSSRQGAISPPCPLNWRRVAALKPVLLDEGLPDLEQMETLPPAGMERLRHQNYSKGHSFSLVAAAWALDGGECGSPCRI